MSLSETQQPLSVGYEPIDHDHQAFIDLLDRLDNASNSDFPLLFQALFQHCEHHFELENELMRRSAFPAQGEHIGEHTRVLGEIKQFKTRVDKGLIPFGRAFVKERLPAWFQLHVSTMDSALVVHVKNADSGAVES